MQEKFKIIKKVYLINVEQDQFDERQEKELAKKIKKKWHKIKFI